MTSALDGVQLSVAMMLPAKFGTDAWQFAFALFVCGGAQLMIKGDCVSLTVTVKLHVAFGNTPLLAVQLTVVVPLVNELPEGGVQVFVGDGEPPPVTKNVTTALHNPGAALLVMLPGQLIVGGVTPAGVYSLAPRSAMTLYGTELLKKSRPPLLARFVPESMHGEPAWSL